MIQKIYSVNSLTLSLPDESGSKCTKFNQKVILTYSRLVSCSQEYKSNLVQLRTFFSLCIWCWFTNSVYRGGEINFNFHFFFIIMFNWRKFLFFKIFWNYEMRFNHYFMTPSDVLVATLVWPSSFIGLESCQE